MATIYDVAKRAGLSIATVSRVLNGSERVTGETRDRILTVVDELGYVPKVEARARARKQTGRIGVLTPYFAADSFVDRLRGIAGALEDHSFEMVVYDVTTGAQRDRCLSRVALTDQVDGLILIGLPVEAAIADRLLNRSMPVVQILTQVQAQDQPFSSIVVDDAAAGRMAAEHLLARGHRIIGYIGGANPADAAANFGSANLDGFRQALALAGVPLPDALVSLAPFGLELARDQAHALLSLPRPPSAIYAASDTQAIGVLSAARRHGLSVPHDLAVIGFDDIEIAEFVGLTTIAQPLKRSGHQAVELLLAHLADRDRPPEHLDVPLTLRERHTT